MARFIRWSLYISLTVGFTFFLAPLSFSRDTDDRFNDHGTVSCYKNNDTIPSANGFNFYVSNQGSDSNDGKSAQTPRFSIGSIQKLMADAIPEGTGNSLSLQANSIFREQYTPVNSNLHVSSFDFTSSKRFAKFTGMDVVKDWNATPATNNVYQHLLKHTIDINSPAYTYIIIAEIDTALEKTHPVSAVKYLRAVSDLKDCNSQPGTYFVPATITNPVMVYVHPGEGVPGKSRFRYEATTRDFGINGFYINNATYENLFLQTSAYGFGMLSGGRNSLVKKVIFQGGGTHHTVLKSGIIDSCLFLPGPKGLKDRIAAVFANGDGKDENNRLTNCIFVDIPNAVYAHTTGQTNNKSLILDNIYAFADTSDAAIGLSANDTDSIEVTNCYIEGYPTGWWYGGGKKLTITNTIFRNTNQSAINPISKENMTGEVKINNVLIETNGNDNNQNRANGWTAFGIRTPYSNVNVEASNMILHAYSTWNEPYGTVTAFQVAGLLKAHHNIYICDVNDDNFFHMYNANNRGGKGTSTNVSSDYNVYILLRGAKFHWSAEPVNNNDPDLFTLAAWQSLTGQDKNSLLIDLRNNPLGLKAVFVDPGNGNWTFTKTPEAAAIQKIGAGMTTPPLFYPKRPPVDNGNTPFKKPGGVSTFTGVIKSESESEVQWQTFLESDISSFFLEYSLDGTHFTQATTIKAVNDDMNHNYNFSLTHPNTDSIFYRLKCFNTDSTTFFSSSLKLKGDFAPEFKIIVYPNPSQQAVTVRHPRRDAGEIRIYDYSGKFLKKVSTEARSSHTPVNLSNLPAGRYFVQWRSNGETHSETLVKM